MTEWEFDCEDCGAPVVYFVKPPANRCAGCQFLVDLPDTVTAEQKAELRRELLERGVIGP